MTTEGRNYTTGFGDKRRGHGPSNVALEAIKVKEMAYFLEPLEGVQHCLHLDVDPMKLI